MLLLVEAPFILPTRQPFLAAISCHATEKLGNSNVLYYKKKNPVELKHCQTLCSYRIFDLMRPKHQKERWFLILEYNYVT